MEKGRILWCLALIFLVQVQVIFGAYSAYCNTTALIEQIKELGLRGGLVPDGNFQASSSTKDHKPERGRLDQKASGNQASAWCSTYANKNQWLLVKLVARSEITSIATQGQFDPINKTGNVTNSTSWVTQYSIQYSSDNKTFYNLDYKYESPLVFTGNSDGDTAVCNNLPYSVKAEYIRIRPIAWKNRVCLRLALFGQALPGNSSNIPAFITPTNKPPHDVWWWWPFFWVLFAFMLLIILLGCIIYCCVIRRRTHPTEKVLKIKPIPAPIQRKPEASFVNSAYDMTVISTQTSDPGTPETVEETGDEIQEVTAEFTADEEGNQRGIVGFSVADDIDSENEDHDYENSDVNWDAYKEKAEKRREQHAYENVDIKDNP